MKLQRTEVSPAPELESKENIDIGPVAICCTEFIKRKQNRRFFLMESSSPCTTPQNPSSFLSAPRLDVDNLLSMILHTHVMT